MPQSRWGTRSIDPARLRSIVRLRPALIGIAFVAFWWALFLGPDSGPSAAALVLLAAVTGVAAAAFARSWWALSWPFAVVPVFSLRAAYTPGAEPEYGIGFLVAVGFLAVALPAVAAGAALGRRVRR